MHGLVAKANHRLLLQQIIRYRPKVVALADPHAAALLQRELTQVFGLTVFGPEGVNEVAASPEADIVVCAIAGAAGFEPCWAALEQGKKLALATKEVLVMAGELVMAEIRKTGALMVPVDSEHNAIHQLLRGRSLERVAAIVLPASGGPFYQNPELDLSTVTPTQALAHPTWRMGPRITIDSATMMNKGLEVIEAHWLFGIDSARIQVVVHPESLVHGMVTFTDGATVALFARPDMRLAIADALFFPDSWAGVRELQPLRFETLGELHFNPPDTKRFRCLELAYQALTAGGSAPLVLNAADEIAVHAFLAGRISFTKISDLISRALDSFPVQRLGTPAEVLAMHNEVTAVATSWL